MTGMRPGALLCGARNKMVRSRLDDFVLETPFGGCNYIGRGHI